ncbi:hypothetical protein C3F09_10720 [candidate division GN15 bacterium]|uniref:Uncharacterized protein n=1 Tax=candidate division GN15 bacterium TaxID=2072418 RepID=A0A855WZF7_9BACT|nr:MAG: hypothetical protein C3F09_10720 [candidate division GN15 bacterium]
MAGLSVPETPAEPVGNDILAMINERIKPLSPVTESGVYVRSMFIVSDQVNSYGGRFPAEEFPRLVELLIDSPVLIGHRKDTLPIGRTFHADTVERNGRLWIKSSFYWLRNGDEAERLREQIDGGIYKECSIGFTFLLPECSLCGEDIRRCRHLPLETYIVNGGDQRCHFNYRQVQKVLETSLVYRGATPDTSMTKDLAIAKEIDDRIEVFETLSRPDDLIERETYTLVPSYDGIDISFRITDKGTLAWRHDGRRIDLKIFGRLKAAGDGGETVFHGRLVGLRGKERCTRAALERFLHSESGPVSRVVLFVYPASAGAQVTAHGDTRHRVQPIRFRQIPRSEIDSAARLLATRRGVEILCPTEQPDNIRTYLYCPKPTEQSCPTNNERPAFVISGERALLSEGAEAGRTFLIARFNLESFMRGRRFVADLSQRANSSFPGQLADLFEDIPTRIHAEGSAVVIDTDDNGLGTVVIRPSILNGRKRYLSYRVPRVAIPGGSRCHAR